MPDNCWPIRLEKAVLPLKTSDVSNVRDGEGEEILVVVARTYGVSVAEVKLPPLEAEATTVRVIGTLDKIVKALTLK